MTELQNIIIEELVNSLNPEIQRILLKGCVPDYVVIPHCIVMARIENKHTEPSFWLYAIDKHIKGEIIQGRIDEPGDEYNTLLPYKSTIRAMAKKIAKDIKMKN